MKLPVTLGAAYHLDAEVGRGGMAVVYSAAVDLEHFDFRTLLDRADLSRSESRKIKVGRRLDRGVEPSSTADFVAICETREIRYPECGRVAVKVLEHTPAQDRFQDEWLNLMSFDHPNLIRVYGGGHDEEQDVYYYVMELVEDVLTVDEMTAAPLMQKLEMLRQSASGLRQLHRSGLIHRDIKPSNLLVTRDGDRVRVRVTDLGVAKDIERSLELTRSRAVIGTPAYMAPEIVRDAREASPRADIYALGATLYTLVTGRAPYAGESLYNVLTQIIAGAPPASPCHVRSGLPRSVSKLIQRMMAHEPDQRPTGMEQLIFDIDSVIADLDGESGLTPELGSIAPIAPTPPPDSWRLLVAESDTQCRELLDRFLARAHYEIETATDGAQALLRVGAGGIDLVIAAAQLPVLDGQALVGALRAQGLDLPVILLVDQTSAPDTLADDELVDVVTKPIALPELVTKLEHIRNLL